MTTLDLIKDHFPEYAIEAWCLGTFMISACMFGVLLFHPASPVIVLPATMRNILMGAAMGTTAVLIIRSPWGKRSGAHFNPAVTLTFLRLGKIRAADAFGYIIAHFIGGVSGVLLSWAVLGDLLSDSAVNFVATLPGPSGPAVAFAAELLIAFVLMSVVLATSNSGRLSGYTPYFAGLLVALYITFEAPLSGMSMNPARTFASAYVSGNYASIWIYFIAPPVAMLAAGELFARRKGLRSIICAKLDHSGTARCIFNCEYQEF